MNKFSLGHGMTLANKFQNLLGRGTEALICAPLTNEALARKFQP
jgi:hypothetical protein